MNLTRAFEVGSKGLDTAVNVGGQVQDKFSFLQVGGRDSVAGVESAAAAAMAASQNAPALAVKLGTAGMDLAVTATKSVLSATGVGAKVAMAIDLVQTAVHKGLDKMGSAQAAGAVINKPAAAAGRGGP